MSDCRFAHPIVTMIALVVGLCACREFTRVRPGDVGAEKQMDGSASPADAQPLADAIPEDVLENTITDAPLGSADAGTTPNDGTISQCAGITCSGHGQCVPTDAGPACDCDPGYDGAACERCTAGGAKWPPLTGDCVDDPCLPDPCPAAGGTAASCRQTGISRFVCECIGSQNWEPVVTACTACVDNDRDGRGRDCSLGSDCADDDPQIWADANLNIFGLTIAGQTPTGEPLARTAGTETRVRFDYAATRNMSCPGCVTVLTYGWVSAGGASLPLGCAGLGTVPTCPGKRSNTVDFTGPAPLVIGRYRLEVRNQWQHECTAGETAFAFGGGIVPQRLNEIDVLAPECSAGNWYFERFSLNGTDHAIEVLAGTSVEVSVDYRFAGSDQTESVIVGLDDAPVYCLLQSDRDNCPSWTQGSDSETIVAPQTVGLYRINVARITGNCTAGISAFSVSTKQAIGTLRVLQP